MPDSALHRRALGRDQAGQWFWATGDEDTQVCSPLDLAARGELVAVWEELTAALGLTADVRCRRCGERNLQPLSSVKVNDAAPSA
jgi:hypothetical protein